LRTEPVEAVDAAPWPARHPAKRSEWRRKVLSQRPGDLRNLLKCRFSVDEALPLLVLLTPLLLPTVLFNDVTGTAVADVDAVGASLGDSGEERGATVAASTGGGGRRGGAAAVAVAAAPNKGLTPTGERLLPFLASGGKAKKFLVGNLTLRP